MPFDISLLRNRKATMVVAVLGRFSADGTCELSEPGAVSVTNEYGRINCAANDMSAAVPIGTTGLRIDQDPGRELQYLPPRGNTVGILILGTVHRKETNVAAVARLVAATPIPDLATEWRDHVNETVLHHLDTADALHQVVLPRVFSFR